MTEDKGILIRNIYYMLAYAFHELRQNNYADIDGETFENIYDLFAEILARGISYQLKQGLYREYVEQSESVQTVRGKIDINSTIAQRMRDSQLVACNYDELSENNTHNQILVATASILIRHSDVKRKRKSQLKKLMLFFQNIRPVDIRSIHWNTLRFDRNNRNYRMLLYVCYFIINEWLMTTDKGKFKMRDFSDENMCRLFEKFVLEYYKKHHPNLKPSATQIEWNIDKELSTTNILPIMQTDILLKIGERTLIIDTKYYSQTMQHQYGKDSIHSDNFYQIQAYVNNYDVGHTGKVDGMLLYAKTKEGPELDKKATFRDGNVVYFKTIDLNTEFDAIKKRLSGFVRL